MSAAATARRLSEAVVQASRSAKFCTAGSLPASDPGLVVHGLGLLRWPLKPAAVKRLAAHCQVAPYGQGTETHVNKSVRNTLELDPRRFDLGPEWKAAVAQAAQQAARELGLPADRVEARLYKLLVYERGGFFLPHRDSEKHDGMVASLVIVLPNPFGGGELVVRHAAARKQTLRFEEAAQGRAPCYAAFYADCEHEVPRVTRGVRVCLTYNLVLTPKPGTAADDGGRSGPADTLAQSIRSWVAVRPGQPLVFALEHHYTQHGLSLDLLKGADRQLAQVLVPAAEGTDCLVHLAQVTRHLQQFADDGSFERPWYRRAAPRRALSIGETYEDELNGTEWTDQKGKKQSWGEIALDPSSIISAIPLDEWTPTKEEYEGYTGNAGNTLDRWYHRSAIVIWHRDQHFHMVASAGPAVSIPLLRSMMAKLPRTPKKRLEVARRDCVRLACGVLAHWPGRYFGWRRNDDRQASVLDSFPELVLKLNDRETAGKYLARMAVQDPTQPLASFVQAACRMFGCAALAQELRQLLAPPAGERGRLRASPHQELPERDLQWLATLCLDDSDDPDRPSLVQELCAVAVERFCAAPSPAPDYADGDWRKNQPRPLAADSPLALLLKALLAVGRGEDIARVIQLVEGTPNLFGLESCQVPVLQVLLPWTKERFGQVHPQLLGWLASVRRKLTAATAAPPVPPSDWARPANVACTCPYCTQLNRFLADPALEVGRIQAREDRRLHVIGMIRDRRCDVTHTLEQRGSPYSLVLTKTTASFERATRQFHTDCRLLQTLDEVSRETGVTGAGERG